jgi:hypothetical protein
MVVTYGLYYKSFTIVIYDRNDSTIVIYDHNDSDQHFKTINYDPRVVIYDPSLNNIDDAWVVIYATIWSVPYNRNLQS